MTGIDPDQIIYAREQGVWFGDERFAVNACAAIQAAVDRGMATSPIEMVMFNRYRAVTGAGDAYVDRWLWDCINGSDGLRVRATAHLNALVSGPARFEWVGDKLQLNPTEGS